MLQRNFDVTTFEMAETELATGPTDAQMGEGQWLLKNPRIKLLQVHFAKVEKRKHLKNVGSDNYKSWGRGRSPASWVTNKVLFPELCW